MCSQSSTLLQSMNISEFVNNEDYLFIKETNPSYSSKGPKIGTNILVLNLSSTATFYIIKVLHGENQIT